MIIIEISIKKKQEERKKTCKGKYYANINYTHVLFLQRATEMKFYTSEREDIFLRALSHREYRIRAGSLLTFRSSFGVAHSIPREAS